MSSQLIRAAKAAASAFFALLLAFSLISVFVAPAYAENEDVDKSADPNNVVHERQLPDGSFLYDTSIEELAGADSYFDGQRVVVSGEVVGDRINDGLGSTGCWITLYSLRNSTQAVYTPSSVAVYANISLTEGIDSYGKYNVRGSTVQVEGTFNLACVEHEGLSDIHATSITVTQQGLVIHDRFDFSAFVPGLVALAAAAALALLYRFLVERRR